MMLPNMPRETKTRKTLARQAILLGGLCCLTLDAGAQVITINNNPTQVGFTMGFNGYLPPVQLRYVDTRPGAPVVTGWAVSASAPLLAPTSTGGTYGYNLPSPTATTTVNAPTYTSYGDATVNAFNAGGLVASKAITIYPRDVAVPNSISYTAGNVSGAKTFTATGNRWVNGAAYYGWTASENYTITGSGATATVSPQPWAPFDEFLSVSCYFVPNGAPFSSSEGYLPYDKTPAGAISREAWITSDNPSNIVCGFTPVILTVDADDHPNAGPYTPGGTSMATGPQSWKLRHFERKWYKNNIEIPGATGRTLAVFSPGLYHCVVKQYNQAPGPGGTYVWYSTAAAEKTSNTILVNNPTPVSVFTPPDFTINGLDVSTRKDVYSCNPMTFNRTAGGGNSAYKIEIKQGTTVIWSSGIVQAMAPAAFDLKSVYPAITAGGNFDIVYTLVNQCGESGASKTGKINVLVPTSNLALQTNAVTKAGVDKNYSPVSTSISSPDDVGPTETTFVIAGDYSSPTGAGVCNYSYHVEQLVGTTWTPVGITTTRSSDCTKTLAKTIGINVAAGGASSGFMDYFNTVAGDMTTWRFVVDLTNDCGTNTKYAVFRLNKGGYNRPGKTGIRANEELADKISFAPMPFTNTLNAQLELGATAKINMRIYTIDGRLVYELKDRSMAAGSQSLEIATNNWQPGIYFYTGNIGDQVINGKLVRR